MTPLVTWSQYRESIGDRSGLFAPLAETWPIGRALYPGSYVDLSPSTAIRSVTYVDTDARAARFFADRRLVLEELEGRSRPGSVRQVRFLAADYTQPLDVPEGSMDLVISLFAGPVGEHTRQYLRPGGLLLANTSHGDASLAALDPSWELVAAVHKRGDPLPTGHGSARGVPDPETSGDGERRPHPRHWPWHRLHPHRLRVPLPDVLTRIDRPGNSADPPSHPHGCSVSRARNSLA